MSTQAGLRTKVANARFKVTTHLFEENIEPLDVAMNDLRKTCLLVVLEATWRGE